jgi:hypothetical protein
MPRWLTPWLLPLAMVAAIGIAEALGSVGLGGSTVVWLILFLAGAGALIRLRLQYLKKHPPDPELTHRPFWRF